MKVEGILPLQPFVVAFIKLISRCCIRNVIATGVWKAVAYETDLRKSENEDTGLRNVDNKFDIVKVCGHPRDVDTGPHLRVIPVIAVEQPYPIEEIESLQHILEGNEKDAIVTELVLELFHPVLGPLLRAIAPRAVPFALASVISNSPRVSISELAFDGEFFAKQMWSCRFQPLVSAQE